MRTYRKKNRRVGGDGNKYFSSLPSFGLTRTSKYRSVQASSAEKDKIISEKDRIIDEKNEEIKGLNDDLKQLDWELQSSRQQYRTLRDSKPPTEKSFGTLPEIGTLPEKESTCMGTGCNIMGGRKRKNKKSGGDGNKYFSSLPSFGLTRTSKYKAVKSTNEDLLKENESLNKEIDECATTGASKDERITILNGKIDDLQKEIEKKKIEIGLLKGTCVAGECEVIEGGRKTRRHKRKSKGKSRRH